MSFPVLFFLCGLSGAPASTYDEDAAPLPIYLQESEVLQIIHDSTVFFSPCFLEQAQRDEVEPLVWAFSVGPAGTLLASDVLSPGSGDPSLDRCLAAAGANIRFPARHEHIERFRYTLLWSGGKLQPFPALTHIPRATGPLFIFLPSDFSASMRDTLRNFLGVDLLEGTGSEEMFPAWKGEPSSNELSPRQMNPGDSPE